MKCAYFLLRIDVAIVIIIVLLLASRPAYTAPRVFISAINAAKGSSSSGADGLLVVVVVVVVEEA